MINTKTYEEPPQLSWSEMADLTHISQVEMFGFCSCEDGPKVYEDCDQMGTYPAHTTKQKAKDYKLNTYANGFGVWSCEISFAYPGMGNTWEAEKIISNAIANAKREIRKAITERTSAKIRRLSYEVSAKKIEPGIGRLQGLTITEK
jgi:hypothetical protein